MSKENKFIWTMAFLIIGVSIGAGILGLPLELGLSGFIPALISLIIVWCLMLAVGWTYLYKFMNSKNEITDYAQLYQQELGSWAKTINSIAYLFTFYCLMIAFISGASSTVVGIIPGLEKIPYIDKFIDILFFIIVTSIIVYGMDFMRKFNSFLMILLFLFFFGLIFFIIPKFNVSYLGYIKWSRFPLNMPILITAFGYHIVLPIIYKHSKENNIHSKGIIKILFLGTFIVLILNILWIFVILGILPVISSGNVSILSSFLKGEPVTVPISKLIESKWIILIALFFSLIAITTSYIGVGAGVMNYIKDLTATILKKRNRFTDSILTFLVPIVITLTYPHLFIEMLNIVGGIGIITSFGILPGIMSIKKNNPLYIRYLGWFILVFSILIFSIESYNILNKIH